MRTKSKHKDIPRLYVVNDNTVLRIVPTLAAEIGLNESILLLQIDFLKSISNTEHKKGRPWTYQSIRQLQDDYFPFWSKDTINRAIASLQKAKLIRCDNFNKAAYDKTRWISINYGKVSKLKSVQVGGLSQNATRSTQNATRSTQNATTIPETSTETTTENKRKKQVASDTAIQSDINSIIKVIQDSTGMILYGDYRLRNTIKKALKSEGKEYLSDVLTNYLNDDFMKAKRAWNFTGFFSSKEKMERHKTRKAEQKKLSTLPEFGKGEIWYAESR